MTGAALIPLRLRAPPGGHANSRTPRDSMRPGYTTLVTAPGDVAHAYFAGVTAHDADAIAACFAEDAELVTNTGTFRGREAIRGFYRDSLLQSADVRPSPGPLIVDGNRVAVEIDLLRGGRHILVGDFFTIDGDTISRLVIFFGPELA
jgi:ketosteroid isomerase-like protein